MVPGMVLMLGMQTVLCLELQLGEPQDLQTVIQLEQQWGLRMAPR